MTERNKLKEAKRIVIKIGTSSLTHDSGKLNLKNIENLAWVLSDLQNQGKEIVLVSSGAIAVGAQRLGLKERPRDIKGKQAASSVGQGILMQIYENFFMHYNQKVAQILITRDVLENIETKDNAKNTFETLIDWRVIPIVNENDTVSIEELGFSDNDTLSAYVSLLIKSDLLIILSDIDGLYDSDPNINKNAKLINKVEKISPDIFDIAGDSSSELGTGGMITKIEAAQLIGEAGIDTIIAKGDDPLILFKILDGEPIGTMICGKDK